MAAPPRDAAGEGHVPDRDFPLPRCTLATDVVAAPLSRQPAQRQQQTTGLLAVRKRRRSVARLGRGPPGAAAAAATAAAAAYVNGLAPSAAPAGAGGAADGADGGRGPGLGRGRGRDDQGAAHDGAPAVAPPPAAATTAAAVATAPEIPSTVPDDDFPAHVPPSDTQVAFMTLRSQWPGDAFDELARLPPVVLVSQLYALVADRAAVDRDVDAMRVANVVRYIKLSAAGHADHVLVLTDDLRTVVTNGKHLGRVLTDTFFDMLLPECTQDSATQGDIDRVFGTELDYATALVRGGLLTLRDEGSFWFSVPYAGYLVKVRDRGNKELLGILRRAPYREMLLVKLELRRLRSSIFPAIFHIRDVIGSNTAETVNTTLGTLVRLRIGLEDPLTH